MPRPVAGPYSNALLPNHPCDFHRRQLSGVQDTQHRFGALHFAYLPVLPVSNHLAPFALWTAFPSALAGRNSGDYYGASVAIEHVVP